MYRNLTPYFLACMVMLSACNTEPQKPTAEEVNSFAVGLEKQVRNTKINFIQTNMLWPAFMDKLYKSGDLKRSARIETEMKRNFAANENERSIYDIMADKGSFTKVKQYEKDGAQHLLYRIEGRGFSYIDFELAKLKEQTGIADIFFYGSGENLSKSVADLLSKLLKHEKSAAADGMEARFLRMKKNLQDANYEQAKKEFDRLPYDIRNSRLFELRYLEILSHLDPAEYAAYLQKIELKYGDNASFQLAMIDVYLNQEKFDKAIAAVNQLDSAINKDPYLDYYRGLITNMGGDTKAATAYFQKMLKSDPRCAPAYAEMVVIHASNKDYPTARRYFALYRQLASSDRDIVDDLKARYPKLEG